MTTNHIDQLAEWWSEAERAPFRKGDMLIARREDECVTYEVYPAGCDHNDPAENVRVLSRAPEPKPAWHDADMVLAFARVYPSDYGERRSVYYRCADGRFSGSNDQRRYKPEDLRDVTPLIEAKVTGEMVESARKEANTRTGVFWERSTVSRILTAALGLETE